MDPIHVKAEKDEGRLSIDAYDAAGLFERAAEHLRAGRYEEAAAVYGQLVGEFKDSRFAAASLYNSGLCHEYLDQYDLAVADYRRLIEAYPDSRDVSDALFRLGGAYEKQQAWDDAARTFARITEAHGQELRGIEQVEALARQGAALNELARYDQAREVLRKAVKMASDGSGVSPSDGTFFHAMAQFEIGEISHAEMKQVALPADESRVEAALEKKCRLLLTAQRQYTDTIRIAHPHWAAAAAFRIGQLYRDLWDDMMAAPPPEDLNEEEREIYLEILSERTRNLLKKAIVQWERTMKMARRLDLKGEWVDQTQKELKEIREIIHAREARAED